jgi:hypothetical protein
MEYARIICFTDRRSLSLLVLANTSLLPTYSVLRFNRQILFIFAGVRGVEVPKIRLKLSQSWLVK